MCDTKQHREKKSGGGKSFERDPFEFFDFSPSIFPGYSLARDRPSDALEENINL